MVVQTRESVSSFQSEDGDATRQFSLDDKYIKKEGVILCSGVQALVRLPIDQHLADKQQGLNTATLVSGYRGSPLGGIDLEFQHRKKMLDAHQVTFISGVNEELAATAIFGSQTANLLPDPKYDGVLGMWYGKGPGLDRSGDVLRHANYAGVGRYGGVLAISGDDPNAKSSTIPSHTESTFFDLMLPVLYPGNVQEVLDMGRYGFELSRYSGLWVGFKIVTNVADEFSTAEVFPERINIEYPQFMHKGKAWQHTQSPYLLTPQSLLLEKELVEGRLEAALHFARLNKLNSIVLPTKNAWLGIVAAGKTYYDLRQALHDVGLDDDELRRHGIRLLKIGMLYPMEPEIIFRFAENLEKILVIEEKRSFIEMFVRDILYQKTERPNVIGKRDQKGDKLIKAYGELGADDIVEVLVKIIGEYIPPESMNEKFNARMETIRTPTNIDIIPLMSRSPFYCSGCPHNRSTDAPEGALVGAGIGCHSLTLLMPNREVTGLTAMGGEGAQWVGATPFTNSKHLFQNIGDGTLFHSGTLAIRQAIATNTNITYKILYNDAVALTGGQEAAGKIAVPDLVRALKAEGAKNIIITSDQPGKYAPGIDWPEGVEIWHRDRLDEAHLFLQEIDGVTILLHDQECANELRRKRRRGKAPEPAVRILINEAVCEGCGDCGVKSNCVSVQPVETEFGRKTQIHQPSCNKDYSCIDGDCPAFVSVVPKGEGREHNQHGINFDEMTFPEPPRLTNGESNLYLMGIGGMGVVTTSQILATAALLDGKFVRSLDQTGLSQKGGPVVSNLKILDYNDDRATRLSAGDADGFLVFDMLTALKPVNLSRANQEKTVAVISTSEVPTGDMVIDNTVSYPNANPMIETIHKNTRRDDNVVFDATKMAETLFGSHMPTNIIVVGAAYQTGIIPISAESIENAITVNGVSVQTNIEAFRAGRLAVMDPEWALTTTEQAIRDGDLDIQPEVTSEARVLIERVAEEGELARLLEIRVPELIAYQNVK